MLTSIAIISSCIHCKTCDIKVPDQDINWTVPQGGEGPKVCFWSFTNASTLTFAVFNDMTYT